MKITARSFSSLGFTLIEVFVSIAILGAIIGLSTPYLFGAKEKASLETESDRIVTTLKTAQQKSIAAYKGYDHAVKIDQAENQLTLIPENQVIKLSSSVQIENTLPTKVIFLRLTGRPETPLEITLVSKRFFIEIVVNQDGLITTTEPTKR